jgi:hypothetical protein
MKAQADMMEQQRISAWYQAHPDRAVHILGHEGAAAIGIETKEWKLQQMNEQAKLEAEQWEARYTARDRQEIARLNEGKKRIAQDPSFSESERLAATQKIEQMIAGIEPSLIPRDPDKPTYPEGKGPQDQWIDENSGALSGMDRSGNPRVLIQPDKMPAALEAKAQLERENKLAEMRIKLMTTMKEDALTGEKSRQYRDIEVESMLERTYPWYREQQIQREQAERQMMMERAAEIQDQVTTAQAEEEWWKDAQAQGLEIREVDKSLPPDIGMAQAYLRQYPKYEDVPEDKRAAWLEAFKIYSNAVNASTQTSAALGFGA